MLQDSEHPKVVGVQQVSGAQCKRDYVASSRANDRPLSLLQQGYSGILASEWF